MTRFRTLDSDWDFNFGKGKQDYASDSLAVSYRLKTKLLSWNRDCFFDAEAGIDWKNILGNKNVKSTADYAVRNVLATDEGVDEVEYFESSMSGRVYTCTARVKTIYGETIEVTL